MDQSQAGGTSVAHDARSGRPSESLTKAHISTGTKSPSEKTSVVLKGRRKPMEVHGSAWWTMWRSDITVIVHLLTFVKGYAAFTSLFPLHIFIQNVKSALTVLVSQALFLAE